MAAWFKKAADIIKLKNIIRAAFVSTNSICQGEQVAILWNHILTDCGLEINYAYRTFKWGNEARGNAAVHCIIVGFSQNALAKKFILSSNETKEQADNINGYLINAGNTFVRGRSRPICAVPPMSLGNQPIDGGHYLFSEEEKYCFLQLEPAAKKWFRPWIGSHEFINRYYRYFLFLKDSPLDEIAAAPEVMKRVEAVRKFRLASKRLVTRELAETPTEFAFTNISEGACIVVPEVSSERRKYIPIGFLTPNILCSNLVKIIPNASLYHLGILHSTMHNTWMRTVCGRLKSDYRYSSTLVYNNFPWPAANEKQQQHIETLAQTVLDVREMYPELTLAKMYSPETMPQPLQDAHTALDMAVDKLYQNKPFADDEQRLQLLFTLYAKLVAQSPDADTQLTSDDEDEEE